MGVAVLGIAHVDVWNHPSEVSAEVRPALVAGVFPFDLVYHILWMLVACGFVLWLCARIWPTERG